MAWLDTLSADLLSIFDGDIARAFVIILLTACLAWGIRPAICYVLDRLFPTYSAVGATLVQLLVLIGGLILVGITADWYSLLVVMLPITAFALGVYMGGQTALADMLATRQLHMRKLYQVGDLVTVGNSYHGIVTEIDRLQTKLDVPGQATVILRNHLVVRSPVTIHVAHEQVKLGSTLQRVGLDQAERNEAANVPQQQLATTQSVPDSPLTATLSQFSVAKGPSGEIDGNKASANLEDMTLQGQQVSLSSSENAGVTLLENEQSVTDVQQTIIASPKVASLWSKIIISPVAIQLTKRKVMGKQSIQDLGQ